MGRPAPSANGRAWRGLWLRWQREGFDGPQVERRHFFGVLYLVVQPAHIEPIGPVDQVGDRQHQGCRLPPDQIIDRVKPNAIPAPAR